MGEKERERKRDFVGFSRECLWVLSSNKHSRQAPSLVLVKNLLINNPKLLSTLGPANTIVYTLHTRTHSPR